MNISKQRGVHARAYVHACAHSSLCYQFVISYYGIDTKRRGPEQIALRPPHPPCSTMAAQWRPDSFHPPCWVVDERIPQHRSDFDRAKRQARKVKDDAKAHDQQLPAWAGAILNVTYSPETGWPDFRRLFLEICVRLVPRDPPAADARVRGGRAEGTTRRGRAA